MTLASELNLGEQPIAQIMADLALKNGDLVAASGEFITRKMVVRACKGLEDQIQLRAAQLRRGTQTFQVHRCDG